MGQIKADIYLHSPFKDTFIFQKFEEIGKIYMLEIISNVYEKWTRIKH